MVSLKIYLIAYFLAAARSIHGYNYAVHLGNLRGGFETGATRGAMRRGGLFNGLVGVGLGGNALGAEGFLAGQGGFGRAVNSRVINTRPFDSAAGRAGGVLGSAFGGARGIIGPLNGGLRSRANGAIGGVGGVDGGFPGGANGPRGEFNVGALIDERGRLGASVGIQGLNGGDLGGAGGSGDALNVVLLNGGFGGLDGGLTGGRPRGDGDSQNGARSFGDRLQNIGQNGGFGNFRSRMVGGVRDFNEAALGSWDIGSNGVSGGISRGANLLGGSALSGLVNRDQANNVDSSGQFGRLGTSNFGVNGLQSSGLRQGRISGGFDDGAASGTFAGGLGNGGVDSGLGGQGGFGGGVNSRALNGGFGRLASGGTGGSRGIDRGEFGGESGPGQGFNDATLLNRPGSVAGVRGLNDGILGDGGAVGDQRGSGNILKVVVVNGGFEGLQGRSSGGVSSDDGDSNIGTGTQRRRLENSDPNVGFGNQGSVVGDGGRGLNRGAVSAGGGLEIRVDGGILTNLLRILSNVVTGLGSGAGASLGDLGSVGRSVGTSNIFNGGNGLDDQVNDGFANGGSSSANGINGELGGVGRLIGGLDALLGRSFNQGRKY